MENTERVILSARDKVLTLMCSFGLLLIMAAVFSLLLMLFFPISIILPKTLAFVLVGVSTVRISVILDKAGQAKLN